MTLRETINSIVAQFGKDVLDDPLLLLGLLEDYKAFEQESPESRTAMRKMVREGQVKKLLTGNVESPQPEPTKVDDVNWGAVLREGRTSASPKVRPSTAKSPKVDNVNWGAVLRQGRTTRKLQPQSSAAASPQNPYASLRPLPSIVKVPKVDKLRNLKSRWTRVKKWIGKNRGEIWNGVIIGIILLLGLLAVVSLFAVFCGLIQGWTNTESWSRTFFWSVVVGLIALGIGEMTIE